MTKFALIVGATGGIGQALARQFRGKGYLVVCFAPHRFALELDEMKLTLGVIPYCMDITSIDDIRRARQFIKDTTGGRLDTLYVNLGVAYAHPAVEYDDARMEQVFRVNLLGPIHVCKYLAKYVVATKGTIVFTTSIAACVPLAWTAVYGLLKAGLDTYARYLHHELSPFGVSVYLVITGGVDTAIAAHAHEDSPSFDTELYRVPEMALLVMAASQMTKNATNPDDYAKVVVPVVSAPSPRFHVYAGQSGWLMGWLLRYLPEAWVLWVIARKYKQDAVFVLAKAKAAAEARAEARDQQKPVKHD